MTREKRQRYAPAFKAKVALAAIQGDKNLDELSQQFNVRQGDIKKWQTQLMSGFAAVSQIDASESDIDQEVSDRHAQFYKKLEDQFRGERNEILKRLEVYMPFVDQMKGVTNKELAIDLGCGRGEWLEILLKRDFNVIGIDLDPIMVAASAELGLPAQQGDALEYIKNCETDSAAIVTGFHIAEHLPFTNLQILADEALRALAPGGILILETPNPENLSVGATNFYLDPSHNRPIPPALLKFLLEYYRFARVKIIRLNEPVEIKDKKDVSLFDVLSCSSPDYAVIAQKAGGNASVSLEDAYRHEYGLMTESLSWEYDGNVRQVRYDLNTQIEDVKNQIEEVNTQIEEVNTQIEEVSTQIEEVSTQIEEVSTQIEEVSTQIEEFKKQIRQARAIAKKGVRGLQTSLENKVLQVKKQAGIDFYNIGQVVQQQGEWTRDFAAHHDTQLQLLTKKLAAMEAEHQKTYAIKPSVIAKQKIQELYWTFTRLLGLGYLHDGSREIELEEQKNLEQAEIQKALVSAEISVASLSNTNETIETNLALDRLNFAQDCLTNAGSKQIESNLKAKKNKKSPKPRLAYFSPMPPLKTGIADYSSELIPELSHYYLIDIISETIPLDAPVIEGVNSVVDVSWFEKNSNLYDRVLYHIGNSDFHYYMLKALKNCPGVVVLHDFYLGHFLGSVESSNQDPALWSRSLCDSHGYEALQKRTSANHIDVANAVSDYPANFFILRQAQGVIFHSRYSKSLVDDFFGENLSSLSAIIPHGRTLLELPDKVQSRKKTDLTEKKFIVCSFGFLGENKLNMRLLEAWIASKAGNDSKAQLIFVGEAPACDYNYEIIKKIEEHEAANASITGFVSKEDYRAYLSIADAAVQLRKNSRGETSGALLDCMAAGLPLIINNHGTFSETPEHVALKIPNQFVQVELIRALDDLYQKHELRAAYGKAAQMEIVQSHAFSKIAKLYYDEIEAFNAKADPINNKTIFLREAEIIQSQNLSNSYALDFARKIAHQSKPRMAARQLFVDISALVVTDLKTGVERVVKAQLLNLLKTPPAGFQVRPIWLDHSLPKPCFKYAHKFTCDFLNIPSDRMIDYQITLAAGDIYFMPDLSYGAVLSAHEAGLYQEMKRANVKLAFNVFDNLPIMTPQFFPQNAKENHENWLRCLSHVADHLICISQTVANDVDAWLKTNEPESLAKLKISAVHLGADFDAAVMSRGLPENWRDLEVALSQRPTFLMVGTIEPRKGHLQTLKAFDGLWREGQDVNLVVVGQEGWKSLADDERRTIPEIMRMLRNSGERQRRLFWLEGISDELLEMIYKNSVCLIAASENEGFGLPLIEAANRGLPILARDIAVFREVAGDHAAFFNADQPEDLAQAIKNWLILSKENRAPKSEGMEMLSWFESVEILKQKLVQ